MQMTSANPLERSACIPELMMMIFTLEAMARSKEKGPKDEPNAAEPHRLAPYDGAKKQTPGKKVFFRNITKKKYLLEV